MLHQQLLQKSKAYSSWHQYPYHEFFHWVGFLVVVYVAFTGLEGAINQSFVEINRVEAATNIFISQSQPGTGDGSSCANAKAVSFFNTASNWGVASGQIGGGATVHLCGTISSALIVQGSGTSGSPISIYFEPNAKISVGACPLTGCIVTNNKSYITVDGGTNGIIENTNNGTAKLAQGSYAMSALGCSNCEFKNLTIQNIYLRTSTADLAVDQTTVRCITFSGSNVLIHDNTMHDVGWCINDIYQNGDTNVRVYNNNIYNVDHGFVLATSGPNNAGSIYFYNNHVHDYAAWDSTTNAYHHDGIHAFGVDSGGLPTVSDFWVYNNIFDGDVGGNPTAHIFLEGGSGAGRTPWTGASGTAHVHNNIFIANRLIYGIVQLTKGTNHEFYNNAILGFGPSQGVCLNISDTSNPKVKNNFFSGCNQLINTVATSPVSNIDYNVYANCASSYNCWWSGSTDTASFSTWKTQTGYDVHSIDSISTNGGIDSSGHPQSGSPMIDAGTNLGVPYSIDIIGVSRPQGLAWDAGAYEYGGTVSPPPSPLPPPPPSPTPVPPPSPSPIPPPSTNKFNLGDRVYVNTNKLNVRKAAGGKNIGFQKLNAKGTIVGGPMQAIGYTWWNVDYDVSPDGWSAENYLTKI